jgi:YidC/Oxa1 family membrane protein insertase
VKELSPERRILVAFALSFVVLVSWSSYMRWKYPPPPPEEAPATAPAATAPVTPAPPPPAAVPAEALATEVKQAAEERLITVETEVASIVFSTRGAVVRSWTLKTFQDEAGAPLELVQSPHTGLGSPLSFAVAARKDEEALANALFVASAFRVEPGGDFDPGVLVFEWSDGRLAARKRFRFQDGYLCEIETSLTENGRPVPHRLAWRGGFGEHADQKNAGAGALAQVFIRTPDGLQRQPGAQAGKTTGWLWKTPSPFPYSGEASYAGIEDRYFAAVFLPQRPQLDVTAWTEEWTPPEQKKPQAVGQVAVGGPAGEPLRLFVGPKAIAVLDSVQPEALTSGLRPSLSEELVDFGWFWWVAKPLFLGMKWLYQHVPNYGWVIILLTIIINTALFPLKWKSMQSAFEMQKVAPQVRAIQERYKKYRFNDPRKQQMQTEIMALYKEHGVNPLGGCLPLALQLPFFYGFYKVLYTAIELRHAPWVGWIQDLSQKDPYYVLPIVMGVTMYVSTKMTPMTVTDPAQQKMMQLFPLLFTFFFLQVSAGLVLYWLMSSVVGIGQQWFINRHQRHREAAEKIAARERKKKKRKGEPPADEGRETDE